MEREARASERADGARRETRRRDRPRDRPLRQRNTTTFIVLREYYRSRDEASDYYYNALLSFFRKSALFAEGERRSRDAEETTFLLFSRTSLTLPKYETLLRVFLGVLCSLGYHIERM